LLERAAVESELRFLEEDVDLYSRASGDRNPLHLDDVFARRTPFGHRIVQGSLVATALLGRLPPEVLAGVRALRVQFAGPALIGARYVAITERVQEGGGWTWEARLVGRGRTLTRLAVSDEPAGLSEFPVAVAQRPMRPAPATRLQASFRAGEEIEGAYVGGHELEQLAKQFTVERLDRGLLEGLACASYVVGMEAPGLHGLFSGVELTTGGSGAGVDGYRLQLREVDARTGRLLLDGFLLGGGVGMTKVRLECFAREPLAAAGTVLDPTTPALGAAVVVVGASRGLGAAVALALLAQGYDVHGAFAVTTDAAAEVDRLAGTAADRLALHRLDARDPGAMRDLVESVRRKGVPLRGLVLNAAPPPLGMGLTADSSVELADYVAESLQLAATPLGAFLPLLPADQGWIVFCSSPALTAPPRDWPHYVAAKGALEGLAHWCAATRPDLRTVVLRPPKLLTDLGNSPAGKIGAIPAEQVAQQLVAHLADAPLGVTTLEP
jgi:NAD(P)-dependent dehydrogenase (short-subunit alcohol dehydrogenase family)/acyl dehydratase